jgi:ABC-2 type transport system ATP-binding protein
MTDIVAAEIGFAEPPIVRAPAMPPAVDVRHLVKRYGETDAVADITFSVAQGEVFAFLGPNGAGKSTTIKMLCTLARPTSGTAVVAGYDVATRAKAVRRHIGLVFQEQTLDDQLTAEENLRFHAVLYRVPHDQVESRIDRVLDLVKLSDRRKDLVSTLSAGMARRLEIARGMLHTPRGLFLDEPTVGLDPQTPALMWEPPAPPGGGRHRILDHALHGRGGVRRPDRHHRLRLHRGARHPRRSRRPWGRTRC